MKNLLLCAFIAFLASAFSFSSRFSIKLENQFSVYDEEINIPSKRNKIQLALLLDTSNSMDGLINQAKAKLWNIVNSMTSDEYQDMELEIALYEYGNSNLSKSTGWIRQLTEFTSDIDQVSKQLFALTTSGGNEYCGQAIDRSLYELDWNKDAAYKVVFISGNESFAQGPVDYRQVIQRAYQKNVIVNTIFCGDHEAGITLGWKQSADLASGEYFVINQNEKVRHIPTPYDEDISKLNDRLNKTYIPYGKSGERDYKNTIEQDANASVYGASNMASRAAFKSKKQYNNANWDLVDAYNKSNDIVDNKKALPSKYKDMSANEIRKDIERINEQRVEIKEKIKAYDIQRRQYIQDEKSKQANAHDLEDSMIRAIERQIKAQGIGRVSDDKDARVDFSGFLDAAKSLEPIRRKRLVDLDEFLRMAEDENTIILDTRSHRAFEHKHVESAVHLNFSDFSEDKLAKVIPSKETRILIYCNNNMLGDPIHFVAKSAPLALNIPTFINLYGYGYENIYELKSDIHVDDERLSFEGLAVAD